MVSNIIILLRAICLFFVFFFALSLADGLTLESKWQQVSSGLQDSSQYPVRSQKCCNLDGLDSFSDC